MVKWVSVMWGCFERSRGLSEIIFCTCFVRLIHTNEAEGEILFYFIFVWITIKDDAQLILKIYLSHFIREKIDNMGVRQFWVYGTCHTASTSKHHASMFMAFFSKILKHLHFCQFLKLGHILFLPPLNSPSHKDTWNWNWNERYVVWSRYV